MKMSHRLFVLLSAMALTLPVTAQEFPPAGAENSPESAAEAAPATEPADSALTPQEEAQEPTAETGASSGYKNYLGVLLTYLMADDNRAPQVDDGNGVSFLFGQLYGSGLGWEAHLSADFFETGDDGGTDYYRQTLGVDLSYSFGNREEFTPFVLLGAGYGRNDVFPDERDDQTWNANAGVGFVTGPVGYENLHLRGEARYIYDDFEDSSTDYRFGLGIEVPLFKDKAEPITIVEEKVQVVEVATGLNDSDGDGVVDTKDKCPDTPAGERVDGEGCTLPKIMTLKGVNFETASSHLRQDSRGILDEVAEIVKRYTDIKFEIAGHTDAQGGESYNQQLSEARAKSVHTYLVEKGANAAQMSVAGYGESQPVATNDTPEGREQNRRVELRIVE